MSESIPPSKQALREAYLLAEEILRNIELNELALARVALKASRLARLLNDFDHQKIFEFEASGYPVGPAGVTKEVWELAVSAGREYQQKGKEGTKSYIYPTSIEELEQETKHTETSLAAARDPDVSVSSANPSQWVSGPIGNVLERNKIRTDAAQAQRRLSARRSFLYAYALRRHHELKFSGIADDIFSRTRERVDSKIGERVPSAVQKLSAVYENLQSDNPEDWANAVHSCRRILQDLADALLPSCEDRVVDSGGKPKTIKMGPDNYINRLIAYVQDNQASSRFSDIVGSHLGFIGDRLDSIFSAAQKGSHAAVSKEEADRYVVYTYLVVGDILTLA